VYKTAIGLRHTDVAVIYVFCYELILQAKPSI